MRACVCACVRVCSVPTVYILMSTVCVIMYDVCVPKITRMCTECVCKKPSECVSTQNVVTSVCVYVCEYIYAVCVV